MLCALGEETDSGASTPSTVVMSPDPELDLDGEGVDMAKERDEKKAKTDKKM